MFSIWDVNMTSSFFFLSMVKSLGLSTTFPQKEFFLFCLDYNNEQVKLQLSILTLVPSTGGPTSNSLTTV